MLAIITVIMENYGEVLLVFSLSNQKQRFSFLGALHACRWQ